VTGICIGSRFDDVGASWLNMLDIEFKIAFMLILMDKELRTPFGTFDTIDESDFQPTLSEAVFEKLNFLQL